MVAWRFSAVLSGPHGSREHRLARGFYSHFLRARLGSARRTSAVRNDAQILDHDRALLRRYLEQLRDWAIPGRTSYHRQAPSSRSIWRARRACATAFQVASFTPRNQRLSARDFDGRSALWLSQL